MGNRRMASWRLPSLPLPFSCRSCFQRRQDTVSTCRHWRKPLPPLPLKRRALASKVGMSFTPQLAAALYALPFNCKAKPPPPAEQA